MTVKRMTKAGLIESLGGTFNPVGHIVLAFADDATAAQAAQALREAGLEAEDVLSFSSSELRPPLEALLRASTGAAGFGYEVTLVRRYIDLANQGAGWLVVRAPDDDVAGRVQAIAKRLDARAGVRYRRLASEELIDASSKREQL